VIFTIFCKRAIFVTFIGASFVILSCWSSWPNPLIMTLQPSATRSSNASPGNAGLNLPTAHPFYQAGRVPPVSRRQGVDADPSLVSYRHVVGYRRPPGNLASRVTRSIGECRMSLWSALVVRPPTSDLFRVRECPQTFMLSHLNTELL
jgi:hypothetical protein